MTAVAGRSIEIDVAPNCGRSASVSVTQLSLGAAAVADPEVPVAACAASEIPVVIAAAGEVYVGGVGGELNEVAPVP